MKDSEKTAKHNSTIDLSVANALDKQVETISPEISDRIDAVRLRALAEQGSTPLSNLRFQQWLPALGTCAALFLVAVMVNTSDPGTPSLTDNDQDLVLEFVLTNQDMELMEEDLEFYLWLAEENS